MRDAFAMGARGYLVKTHDVDAFLDGLGKLFERGFSSARGGGSARGGPPPGA
jgi:hypothetical protein